jgi:hypothetical protein
MAVVQQVSGWNCMTKVSTCIADDVMIKHLRFFPSSPALYVIIEIGHMESN